jgi:uncharacterized Zn finger protein
MKVKILNVKGEDKQLICPFCKNEEFSKSIVENKIVKTVDGWNGEYRDGYTDDETIKFTCNECGYVVYFEDKYDIDIDRRKIEIIGW